MNGGFFSRIISYTRTAIRDAKASLVNVRRLVIANKSCRVAAEDYRSPKGGRSGRLISFSVDCQILVPHCETRMEHRGDRCIPVVSSGRKDQQ